MRFVGEVFIVVRVYKEMGEKESYEVIINLYRDIDKKCIRETPSIKLKFALFVCHRSE